MCMCVRWWCATHQVSSKEEQNLFWDHKTIKTLNSWKNIAPISSRPWSLVCPSTMIDSTDIWKAGAVRCCKVKGRKKQKLCKPFDKAIGFALNSWPDCWQIAWEITPTTFPSKTIFYFTKRSKFYFNKYAVEFHKTLRALRDPLIRLHCLLKCAPVQGCPGITWPDDPFHVSCTLYFN